MNGVAGTASRFRSLRLEAFSALPDTILRQDSMLQSSQRPIRRLFSKTQKGHEPSLTRPVRPLRGFEQLETRRLLHGEDVTGGDVSEDNGSHDEIPADFSLMDVNPTSATYQQKLSPRDYLDHVSVWLFGWST